MVDNSFFDEVTEQSLVKATVVQKYFDAWAGIIIGAKKKTGNTDFKIGYVDLFAGPGRYESGSKSTPLLILEKAVAKPEYAKRLVTIFNDKDQENVRSLEDAVNAIPGIENLEHRPIIWHKEVGDEIAGDFERINTIPILAFIDPWGYKGLSLGLVNAFLKSWGCDCIFFFNYSRINAGLSNPYVHAHMCALFGEQRAKQLRTELEPMSPQERVEAIIEGLSSSFKQYGHKYVLPFGFKNETGRRTTHHLILVTKSFKGYEVMKDIMAKESSEISQGVPSLSYIPTSGTKQGLLFDLNQSLDTLKVLLTKDFRGRSLTMRQVYEEHSVDRPYIAKNYKDALIQLEGEGRIKANPPAVALNKGKSRPKGTFGDRVTVTFPE